MIRILLLVSTLCAFGCAHQIERPYVKETTTNKDGSVTVKEYSADWVKGGVLK